MSDSAEKVKKIVVEHLGVEADKVTEEASFIDDLGADSLDIVELVMAFEEEFGVEIPDDAAERSPPSRMRSTISKRTRAKASLSGIAGYGRSSRPHVSGFPVQGVCAVTGEHFFRDIARHGAKSVIPAKAGTSRFR